MDSWKTIVGGGKTFAGALFLVISGLFQWLGWLPDGVHLNISPVEAISGGLIAVGLGTKLQWLIELMRGSGAAAEPPSA